MLFNLKGELQHKLAKRRYKRTNKNNFIVQLAKQDARERLVSKIWKQLNPEETEHNTKKLQTKNRAEKLMLPHINHMDRYHISDSMRNFASLDDWLEETESTYRTKVPFLVAFMV